MRPTPARTFLMIVIVVLIAGCSSATRVSTRAGSTAVTAVDKVVHFDGVAFDVPATWPVFDLTVDPKRCVRFDVNAVYLGKQGPEAACPARLLGRTDAVQIEPLDLTKQQQLLPTASTDTANGLQMLVQPQSETTRTVTAEFPQAALVMTVSFFQDSSHAEQILHSVRRA